MKKSERLHEEIQSAFKYDTSWCCGRICGPLSKFQVRDQLLVPPFLSRSSQQQFLSAVKIFAGITFIFSDVTIRGHLYIT